MHGLPPFFDKRIICIFRPPPTATTKITPTTMSNQVPGPSDDGVTPSAGLSRVGAANAVTESHPSPPLNVERERTAELAPLTLDTLVHCVVCSSNRRRSMASGEQSESSVGENTSS